MKYRELGKTGLQVSEVGFGAQWLRGKDLSQSQAIVEACEEAGINILDCWTPDPPAQEHLGDSLRGSRERWIIQGHIGATWQNEQYVKTRNMDKVIPAFESFLDRMHTDYIDLGMIHYVDTQQEWDELMNGPYMEYVRRLKRDGVIRHIGLSTHNQLIGMKAARQGEIEMIMFAINPAFDMMPPFDDFENLRPEHYDDDLSGMDPEREQFYHMCEEENIGITAMKSYASGRLFDASRSPFGVALTPVQCIHYALTRPAVASVLCGYDSPEEVGQAVAYETVSDDEKNFARVLAGAPHYSDNRGCMYCNHCLPCPSGIDIGSVIKYYDLATMHEEVPPTVRSHYRSLGQGADSCIACGGCEKRCPFQVPVMEIMEKAAELFG